MSVVMSESVAMADEFMVDELIVDRHGVLLVRWCTQCGRAHLFTHAGPAKERAVPWWCGRCRGEAFELSDGGRP
jgi:hypothetical protein